jgi:hypothetical protein
MGAVTYPEPAIVEFLNHEVVPLRINSDVEPLASQFWVRWTPALFMLDPYGNPHQSHVGYLAPAHFIPQLLLGKAKTRLAMRRFHDALADLERILGDHPQSFVAPEAVYLRAVCRYRTTKDPHHLRVGYQLLLAEYPASDHAQRAQPYRNAP